MQLYPADFMSAAQMSKDRRQGNEALDRKRSPRAGDGTQSGITELQDRRIHLKCKTLQQKGCSRSVGRAARAARDGRTETDEGR